MNSQKLIAFTVSLIVLGTIASVVADTIRSGWVPGYGMAIGFSLIAIVLLFGWRTTDRFGKF